MEEEDELEDDEWDAPVSSYLFFIFPFSPFFAPSQTGTAARGATESRKRKGTLLPDPTAKRRAGADKDGYVFEVSHVRYTALTGTNQYK